jgi:hypothetical protein
VNRLLLAAGVAVAVVTGSLAWHDASGRGGPDGQLIPVAGFEVTSGTWRATGSGPGSARTSSPTFRARSERADLASPEVELRFRIDGHLAGAEDHDWDGVHVGLRYTSPDDLYYVSVARRDGSVAVKRKSAGRYETLATADHRVSADAWHVAVVAVEDTPDGTVLRLTIDGEEVLEAFDEIDAALPPGGRVLLRSDNVSATFGGLRVRDAADPGT